MDTFDDLRLATAAFDDRLVTVRPDQWAAPTPCEDWTVRDLVDHVTGGNRFAVALLDGATLGGGLRGRRWPPASATTSLGDSRGLGRRAGSRRSPPTAPWRRSATTPAATSPAPRSSTCASAISLVHTWDLARAIGGDERLDDRLVARVWAHYGKRADKLAASGMFGAGASGAVGGDAPLQDRLLDVLGRRP